MFPVSGVIRGWTEALQRMKVGDKWKLFIPSDLAYGANESLSPEAYGTILAAIMAIPSASPPPASAQDFGNLQVPQDGGFGDPGFGFGVS